MLNNQGSFNLVRDLTSSLIVIIRRPTHFTLFNYHGTAPQFSTGKFIWQFQSFLIFLPFIIWKSSCAGCLIRQKFFHLILQIPFPDYCKMLQKTLQVWLFLKSILFHIQIKSFTYKWQFCCVSITLALQGILPHDRYICPLPCITLVHNIL